MNERIPIFGRVSKGPCRTFVYLRQSFALLLRIPISGGRRRQATRAFVDLRRSFALQHRELTALDLGQRRFPSAEGGGNRYGEAGEETATRSAP
jgi:hypothetical protein